MRARLMAAGLVEGRAVAGTLAAAALVSLLLAAPTVAAAGDRARPGDAHPSGLTLRLLSLRSTYSLEDDGARLRKKIDDARRAEAAEDAAVARETTVPGKLRRDIARSNHAVAALAVELAIEITNGTGRPIEILGDGDDRTELTLTLEGPGVELMRPWQLQTMELRVPRPIILGAGQSHRIVVSRLAYGQRGDRERAYWTVPGRYTLAATLATAWAPDPRGLKPGETGFAPVVLTSNTITIGVQGRPTPRPNGGHVQRK